MNNKTRRAILAGLLILLAATLSSSLSRQARPKVTLSPIFAPPKSLVLATNF